MLGDGNEASLDKEDPTDETALAPHELAVDGDSVPSGCKPVPLEAEVNIPLVEEGGDPDLDQIILDEDEGPHRKDKFWPFPWKKDADYDRKGTTRPPDLSRTTGDECLTTARLKWLGSTP